MQNDILDCLNINIISVDKTLTITSLNNCSYMFFGYDVVGLNIGDVFVGDNDLIKSINNVLKTKGTVALAEHKTCVYKVGDVVLDLHLANFHDVVLISITETKAESSNNELFAMIAHEIKNPLAGIRGAGQIISKNQPNEMAELIINETDRITKLINQLEDITSLDKVEFAPVSIHSVLDNVALISSNINEDIEIERLYDPSLPNIFGESDKLIQLFLNLVKNSIEAPNTTKVIIKTYYMSGVNIVIDNNNHKAVCVEISNDGEAIPTEVQSKMFIPHKSDKKGGTGLGLAIVSMLVKAHMGRITFETSNDGTKFFVILPMDLGV